MKIREMLKRKLEEIVELLKRVYWSINRKVFFIFNILFGLFKNCVFLVN